jgi:hypothetical protein
MCTRSGTQCTCIYALWYKKNRNPVSNTTNLYTQVFVCVHPMACNPVWRLRVPGKSANVVHKKWANVFPAKYNRSLLSSRVFHWLALTPVYLINEFLHISTVYLTTSILVSLTHSFIHPHKRGILYIYILHSHIAAHGVPYIGMHLPLHEYINRFLNNAAPASSAQHSAPCPTMLFPSCHKHIHTYYLLLHSHILPPLLCRFIYSAVITSRIPFHHEQYSPSAYHTPPVVTTYAHNLTIQCASDTHALYCCSHPTSLSLNSILHCPLCLISLFSQLPNPLSWLQ